MPMIRKAIKAHRTIVKSRLIVFEGLDGVGKTTIINQIKKRLVEQGYNVLVIANPYGLKKNSWTTKLHRMILQEKLKPLNQALLYLAIINENQYLYCNKKYDFVLIDRYLQSTLAYNVFYPALNPRPSQYKIDHLVVARSIIRLFKQSALELEILPCENLIIQSAPDTFNLPDYDYDKLNQAYDLARPLMQKLYGYFGAEYPEKTLYHTFGEQKIIEQILEIVIN